MYKTEIEYWEERSAQRMWKHMENAEKISKEISKSYLKASQYLDQQIDEVFLRFKNKHELSTVEAKRLLNMMHDSTSIQSLKLALQQSKDSEEKAELLKMLESPAYSARIKRFEEMQEQLDVIMNNVYQTEKSLSTKHYVDLASDSYYCSIFDIQKGTGVGFQFAHVSQDEIDKLLHSNWSGINYTHRIWGNTNRLAKTLKEEMLVSLMTGRSNLATAEVFREKFNVGAFEARRLIRTESAYIVNEMEQQAYEECDIEKYMFVATLDKRTSEICQKKDHKVYAVKERAQGVNCLHMHPFCRSTTIAYLDDETISNMERLATDDETGEKNKILANTSYEQWIKSVNGDTIKVEEEFVKLYSGEEANRFFYYDDYKNNHGLIAKKNGKYG